MSAGKPDEPTRVAWSRTSNNVIGTIQTTSTNTNPGVLFDAAMVAVMSKQTPTPTVLISSVDADGISPWDCCLICRKNFGDETAEIFQVSDHANHARHGMHTRCVVAMIDKQSTEVASDAQFDRYLRKIQRGKPAP